MSVALLLVLASVLPPPAGAAQSALDQAARDFAEAWRSHDIRAVRDALDHGGVRLRLDGSDHGWLETPQAVAAIDGLLGRLSGGRVRTHRTESLGGDPPRGYTELRWVTVARGTTQPLAYTVFVGFTRREEGWRVDEIRVLPSSTGRSRAARASPSGWVPRSGTADTQGDAWR